MTPISTRTSNAGEAGYTLIEMLVVLVILGLVAGAGATAFVNRRPAMDLGKAVSKTQDTLARARDQAVASGARVVVAADGDRLGVVTGDTRELVELGRGMRVAVSGGPALVFHPDGSSSGGAVELGEGDDRETVALEWLTGRAERVDAR